MITFKNGKPVTKGVYGLIETDKPSGNGRRPFSDGFYLVDIEYYRLIAEIHNLRKDNEFLRNDRKEMYESECATVGRFNDYRQTVVDEIREVKKQLGFGKRVSAKAVIENLCRKLHINEASLVDEVQK